MPGSLGRMPGGAVVARLTLAQKTLVRIQAGQLKVAPRARSLRKCGRSAPHLSPSSLPVT